MQYTAASKLTDEHFRRLTGVKKTTFIKMLSILGKAHIIKKARGGRPNKISLEDMLMMTLEYLREYRTYFHIAGNYGLSESYAYKLIRWTEDTLIKSGEFSLPGKKALYGDTIEYSVVLIDATETPIERPEKNRKTTTQARKKRHTLKTQLVVNKTNSIIICTHFCTGKKHDFKLFKESKLPLLPATEVIVDSGYLGIKKNPPKLSTPQKEKQTPHTHRGRQTI